MPRPHRRRPTRRLSLQSLETRRVLATFFVGNLSDTGGGICNADDPGGAPSCDLRSAISAAAFSPGNDTISLATGQYNLAAQFGPGNTEATLIVDDVAELDFVRTGNLPGDVVVNGDGVDRVFDLFNAQATVRFNDLTILGGRTSAFDTVGGAGIFASTTPVVLNNVVMRDNRAGSQPSNILPGGAIATSGTLTIVDSRFEDNFATGSGGAVAILPPTGPPAGPVVASITNTVFISNVASQSGGAIENDGGNLTLNSVTIGGSLINDGNSAGIDGGGLHATGASTVTINGGTITGNTAAAEGGGVWNAAGTLNLAGAMISNNTAQSAGADSDAQGGGGLFNDGGTVNVSGTSMFTGNVALDPDGAATNDDGGGAVFNNGGTISIIGTATFRGNSATNGAGNGGAILNLGGSLTITGGVIAANSAARAGGGVENNDGIVTLTGVQLGGPIGGNSAAVNGGGLHATGTSSSTTVTGGTVQFNAAGQEGGGLWNGAGSMSVDGTTITQNSVDSVANGALDQGGGGVFNIGGSLDIDNASISFNTALINNGNGGGVMTVGGIVTIDGGTISGNAAARAGGGIENNNGSLTVTNVLVSDNTADINGGGVHASGLGSTDFNSGTVRDNTALQEGGGLWNGGGSMTIDATLISGNTAGAAANGAGDQGGGGIFNVGGSVTLQNGATVASNIANTNGGFGGGILSDGGGVNITGSSITNNDLHGISLINFAAGTITGNTFSGNFGADVHVRGNDNGNFVDVTPGVIAVDGVSTTIDGTVGSVRVESAGGTDKFNVTPSLTTAYQLDAGDRADVDVLNFDANGFGVTQQSSTLLAGDSTGNNAPVTFDNLANIDLSNTNGDLTVVGSDVDDLMEIFTAPPSNQSYRLTSGGVAGPLVNFNGTTSLTFNGSLGNDTLRVINPIGGLFDLGLGIVYDGGGQGAGVGDTLEIVGGTAARVEHTFTNESDGQITYNGLTSPSISYVGLEPIIDTVVADQRVFTFTGGAETITLGDDGDVGDNESQIDSTLGESVTFVNPVESLTIDSGTGNDIINVVTLDSSYAASLIHDGGFSSVNTLTMTNVDSV